MTIDVHRREIRGSGGGSDRWPTGIGEMRVAARRREIRGSGGRGDRRPARLGVRITRGGHRREIRSAEEGEIDPKLERQRRAKELRDEVKGMKKKLPKRAPTEWSAFKHEHSGEGLNPAAMSSLYKRTEKEEKQEILGRYKEYLAAKAEESE